MIIPNVFASHDSDKQWGTVNADKSVLELPYTTASNSNAERVKIFGVVEEPKSATWIYMTITKPSGTTYQTKNIVTKDGYYENFILVCCNEIGKYTVYVEWLEYHVGTVTFDVIQKSAAITEHYAGDTTQPYVGALVELYPLYPSSDGDVDITITAPDSNKNPNAIEFIGNSADSRVTIITSKGTLDFYKLKETRADAGVFEGSVSLNHVSTSGTGPWAGKIKTNNQNAISCYHPNGEEVFNRGPYTDCIKVEFTDKYLGITKGPMVAMLVIEKGFESTTFSNTKVTTLLELDPLSSTFETTEQNPDGNSAARIYVSGQLISADRQYVITDAEISFVPSGFTFTKSAPSTIITDSNGEFETSFTLPVGNDFSFYADFEGGTEFYPSQSQTEYFAVISGPMSTPSGDNGAAGGAFLLIIIIIIVVVIIAVKKRKKGAKFTDSAVLDELQTSGSEQRTVYRETYDSLEEQPRKLSTESKPTLPKDSSHDTFTRLKDYIIHARDQQANYQPVMIRILLKEDGYCSKESIVNELHSCNANEKRNWTFYKTVPVFDVLEKNGIVKKEARGGYSLIGFENITPVLRDTLIGICDEKIDSKSQKIAGLKNKLEQLRSQLDSAGEEETHYLLLRHKIQNQWADDLGKKYHYGTTVPHYKKLKPGTKTVWYDKKQGDYYLWGFGTVSNVRALPMSMGEKISHQTKKFHAYFDDFKQFEEDKPIIGSNHIQEKIAECFSNIQHSIIVINKEIFDEITSMVQSTPVSENTSSYGFKEDYDESDTKSQEEELSSSDNTLIKNKNLFMINGPWGNWEHSFDNSTPEGYVIWGTRGADSSDMGIYNKLKTGDIIFFSNSTKDPGPFSRKMIFGYGKAKRKFEGTKPYWPEEVEKNKVIWRYRFEFEVLFETYDEETAITWIQGLPFTKGFNSIANPDTITQLFEIVNSKWNQKLSYEKPHRNMFDADGKYVSRAERTVEEEDIDYESVTSTGFSDWENKIKRRLEHSGIEFDYGDTRNFDLYYEGKKLPTYNPDFILRKHKIKDRSVILEAHEIMSPEILPQHYAFLKERGDQYYIIIIVKNEDYKKWKTKNDERKFADEIVSESKMHELITRLIFAEERKKVTRTPSESSGGKSKIETCINCGTGFEIKGFYDEFDEVKEGKLELYCPECRKYFE